jgi:hypothetical protein
MSRPKDVVTIIDDLEKQSMERGVSGACLPLSRGTPESDDGGDIV